MKNILNIWLIFSLFLSTFSSADNSRILATGGVSQIEGSAGGGIVPWAVIAGYAQEGEWGATIFSTQVIVDDFHLTALGAAIGIDNRFEISIAKQTFDLGPLASQINLPRHKLSQNIYAIKLKLFGDLIYGSLPQISLGGQHKELDDFSVPLLAGARYNKDNDYYLSASKLWLTGIRGYPLLLNVTVRSTTANQLGLLGFGGDINNAREVVAEINTSIFLTRNWVLGYEYREKPNNLSFSSEDDWQDIYLAWFYDKSVSAVISYVDLGSIASLDKQKGFYLSLQASF